MPSCCNVVGLGSVAAVDARREEAQACGSRVLGWLFGFVGLKWAEPGQN
jgi:hypothetical protein